MRETMTTTENLKSCSPSTATTKADTSCSTTTSKDTRYFVSVITKYEDSRNTSLRAARAHSRRWMVQRTAAGGLCSHHPGGADGRWPHWMGKRLHQRSAGACVAGFAGASLHR